MRKGFLASLATLCTGAGLAFGQLPSTPTPIAVAGGDTPQAAPKAAAKAAPAPATPSLLPAPAAPTVLNDSCAGGNCGGESGICGPAGRVWASAEYLYWWFKDQHVPALVTAGSESDTTPGALGQPGTSVLVGGDLDSEGRSGARFTVGFWLNECQTSGIEANYFLLGSRTNNIILGSSGAAGSPVIARPFFDVLGNTEDATMPGTPFQNAELVAFPGVAAGTVTVRSSSRMQGAEVNGLCNLCCCGSCDGYRVDLVYGFRWVELDEGLGISESIAVSPEVPPAFFGGSTIGVADTFGTRNNFYGGQVGVRGEVRRDKFFVNGRTLVALGGTHQEVTIAGNTVVSTPGATPTHSAGGLLALPTNIGHYSRNEFSFIPEIGVNVGYQVTDHLRAYVGYTFLYWSDVVRPGDVIDTALNVTQVPTSTLAGPLVGPARPAFQFKDSDFWAQGINFGIEVRY